jgi:maltose alpha-D-glucosyltransferase/alpha-amylase
VSAPGSEKRMSFDEELREALPRQLPGYLASQRWFGGKARQIRSTELVDVIPLPGGRLEAFVLLARVEYASGSGETYVLPLVCQREPAESGSEAVTLQVCSSGRVLVLSDALRNGEFLLALLDAMENRVVLPGVRGEIRAACTSMFQELRSSGSGALRPRLLGGEQSNSSIIYGDRLILKVFRRLEEGVNPDLEIGLFLTEKARFRNVPPVAGWLEYLASDDKPMSLGILQGFVANDGDAWRFTLRGLASFWHELSKYSRGTLLQPSLHRNSGLLDESNPPAVASAWVASYLDAVGLLGKRTAQMHVALASEPSDSAFAPEPYTASFQRTLEESVRGMTDRNFDLLRQKRPELPEEQRSEAGQLVDRRGEILQRLHSALSVPIRAMRTRIHGDYHLGQVLYTGCDFVMIDFEGEPARPLSERRMKRSPLQDVAGMLRSFHYAAFGSLLVPLDEASAPDRDRRSLLPWAGSWYAWASTRFLQSYLEKSGAAAYLPASRGDLSTLLQLHLLEKAIYELGYELNNRPPWVGIPLAGISALLRS